MRILRSFTIFSYLLWLATALPAFAAPDADVIFVTVPPFPTNFSEMTATLANHTAALDGAPRGGDLYIRYKDGTVRNLTAAAGYGGDGFLSGNTGIAVRDPSVHWDGNKVIFSMVVGAPTEQYQVATYYWQLYEMTNFGKTQTPVIAKVANQPANYNNIDPVYGTDGRILFVSDRPRDGSTHLYPQLDEYESAITNTGVWSLDPGTGDVFLLDHSPSGDFEPIVDSAGRVIFTRWDHMQRDQQADNTDDFGGFNYSSEAASSTPLNDKTEVYPEIRAQQLADGTDLHPHSFNHFFPWQVNEDGTELETLNHIGRHELHGFFEVSFNNDNNLQYHHSELPRFNPNSILNVFHIQEDPLHAGTFFAIDAPEFGTHASGQIISINGGVTTNPDQMAVTYITHRETATADNAPPAEHIGLFRDPLPLSDGTLIAAHTSNTQEEQNVGTSNAPLSRFSFRLKTMQQGAPYWTPNQNLTSGITKSFSYWNPDSMVSFNGTMWEIEPVEVRVAQKPAKREAELPMPEKNVLTAAGVDEATLRLYLKEQNLALVVSRNITTRDSSDLQQPFNLKVAGSGGAQTVGAGGKIYEVAFQQFFQGDLIRGYYGYGDTSQTPNPGRRVLAQFMHDPAVQNPAAPGGPTGSVQIGADGSVAAFVPARRALTYQLTDSTGKGILRERYWLTFQPGEIRVCASCHGVNTYDQAGHGPPENEPQALASLLAFWNGLPRSDAPAYKLSFKKSKKGKKLQLRVKGTNAAAASKQLTLRTSLNAVQCESAGKTFTTDGSGNSAVNLKLPNKGALRILFSLQYSGIEVGKITKRIKGKKIPERNLSAICGKIRAN